MHAIYDLAGGLLVWVSVFLFIGGSIYRLVSMAMLARKRDIFVYEYMDPFYAFRSIAHWIVPFGSVNMRKHPWMTIVTFAFHLSLLIVPLFLFAHIALVKESWNFQWKYIPDSIADVLTLIVIGSCIFFLIRRCVLPEVKYLTSRADYLLLLLVALPFVTGLWTHYQLVGYKVAGILHILSGEILLAAIPFTRLSHMIFFLFARGYMGSEFGAVRHARDW